MSSGPFVRTKNSRIIKPQQTSLNNNNNNQTPIKNQVITTKQQQNKGAYVYKPPVRTVKNLNNVSINSSASNIKKQDETVVKINQDVNKQLTVIKQNIPFTRKNQNSLIDQVINMNDIKNQQKLDKKTQSNTKQITPIKLVRKHQNENSSIKNQQQKSEQQKPITQLPFSRIQRSSEYKNEIQLSDRKKQQKQQDNYNKINQSLSNSRKKQQQISSSSSSFYKKNINKIQNKKAQLNSDKKEQQKVKPKRSNIILFNLRKLFKNKLQQHFSTFKTYTTYIKQRKNNKIISLYLNSLINILINNQKHFIIQTSFNKIKLNYSNQLKIQSSKIQNPKSNSSLNNLIQKRNSTFCKILQNVLFNQKEMKKNTIKKIKNYAQFIKNKSKFIINCLIRLEKKIIKNNFNMIKQQKDTIYMNKKIKLIRLNQIINHSQKNIIHEVFIKIMYMAILNKSKSINSKHSNSNMTNSTKRQQQTSTQQQNLLKQIQELQTKIQNFKNIQNPQLKQKLQNLKTQKQRLQKSNQQKIRINKEQQQKLQILIKICDKNKQQKERLKNKQQQQKQSKLPLLHQIYMQIHRLPQQQCTSQQFLTNLFTSYHIDDISQSNEQITNHLNLYKNLQLKHQINRYQRTIVQKSQRVHALEEQNQIIKKFIRNYVKQTYMWEEIQQYVAAVMQ